jgi:glutamine synthetase adenylyltransferase
MIGKMDKKKEEEHLKDTAQDNYLDLEIIKKFLSKKSDYQDAVKGNIEEKRTIIAISAKTNTISDYAQNARKQTQKKEGR